LGRVPVWIGGNTKRAIRRAVSDGQGWMPFPSFAVAREARTTSVRRLDDLRPLLANAEADAEEIGRGDPLDVCFGQLHAADGSIDP
jgi:DNA-binding transcriptional LysR family regulator